MQYSLSLESGEGTQDTRTESQERPSMSSVSVVMTGRQNFEGVSKVFAQIFALTRQSRQWKSPILFGDIDFHHFRPIIRTQPQFWGYTQEILALRWVCYCDNVQSLGGGRSVHCSETGTLLKITFDQSQIRTYRLVPCVNVKLRAPPPHGMIYKVTTEQGLFKLNLTWTPVKGLIRLPFVTKRASCNALLSRREFGGV